jgi:hypothetical protein
MNGTRGDVGPRCLFCGSTTAKRSKEHVLRRAFKDSLPSAPGLTFSHRTRDGLEVVNRPISQFDMTINNVCRDCNQGWLNDVENAAQVVIEELTVGNTRTSLTQGEVECLGFWAYLRALLRTHVSPRGRAPAALFQAAYRARKVPDGCYVQLGASLGYVLEAGSHQSLSLQPGDHYLGFVAFGLGALVFLVAISDSSPEAARRALDVVQQPGRWFPHRFRGLAPVELPVGPLGVLSPEEAVAAGVSMLLRVGAWAPFDHFGKPFEPRRVIPREFHRDLAWRDLRHS